jgi:hypothetical protein
MILRPKSDEKIIKAAVGKMKKVIIKQPVFYKKKFVIYENTIRITV